MNTVFDFSVKDRKGKMVALKEYANEVLLIVNTATKCGFTPQYEELEKLYEKYHSQGFEILDFPCNQFGQQEARNVNQVQQRNAESVAPADEVLDALLPFHAISHVEDARL